MNLELLDDTIVALSSASGPGARAVVRLSGPAALPIIRSAFVPLSTIEPEQRRVYRGEVRLSDPVASLPAELYFWPAPRSYTGQAVAELHILSCPPLVELVISRLLQAGARSARPGEFTLRAFLAGKLDLARAEAVRGVIEAGSHDELSQALVQLAGGVSSPLRELRDDLLNLLADLEAGLDFTEEDIHFIQTSEMLQRLAKGLARLTLLQKQLEVRSLSGRPFRVVLAGRPNAGKSSLFNALVQDSAALVSSQPGTTRDYLARQVTWDGVTIELVDTAGWQESVDSITHQAQHLGRAQAEQADLLLLCVEAGKALEENEKDLLQRPEPPMARPVATKCDLAEPASGLLATSAVRGTGLQDLRDFLGSQARARRQPALAPSVSRCRNHVGECIRRLRLAHELVLFEEPAELIALEVRGALDELGELVGAIYTDDLLDRIFSRFCIGK